MAEHGVTLIDDYLAKLRKGLAGLPDCDDSVAEAEDHLRETADAYVESGMNQRDAEFAALRQFGSASLITHAHVVDHRKGAAVATTFTRYSGLAGAALVPLLLVSIILANVSAGTDNRWFLRSLSAFVATAGVFAFVFGFLGLAARHKNALGGWGRASKIVLYLSLPLSIPFMWAAAAAFAGWLAIAATLLAIGMFRIGVLPRVPLAGLAAAPPIALATLGVGTLAGYDMGQTAGNLVSLAGICVVSASIGWLGLIMWREPAVDRRGNTGPFATA